LSRAKGPFPGFLLVLVLLVVALGVIYVVDVVLTVLEQARSSVAGGLGVEETTEYSARADQVVSALGALLVFVALMIIVVYSMHLERR
jgi:uncharacterized membrane protein